jgi:cell division protein FtsQ
VRVLPVHRTPEGLLRPSVPATRRRPPTAGRLAAACLHWGLLLGAPAALVSWVATSPRFFLRQVEVVTDGERVPAGAVQRAVAPLVGQRLLTVSLEEVRERLAADPWVETVELEKQLPDRLVVRVRQRRAVAVLVRRDGSSFLDRQGRIIAPCPEGEETTLLEVTTRLPPPVPVAPALALRERLATLRPEWAAGVREMEILGEGEFRLATTALPFPITVRDATLEPALRRLTRLLPELSRRYPEIRSADLRFSDRIVVQPADGGAAAAVASANQQR